MPLGGSPALWVSPLLRSSRHARQATHRHRRLTRRCSTGVAQIHTLWSWLKSRQGTLTTADPATVNEDYRKSCLEAYAAGTPPPVAATPRRVVDPVLCRMLEEFNRADGLVAHLETAISTPGQGGSEYASVMPILSGLDLELQTWTRDTALHDQLREAVSSFYFGSVRAALVFNQSRPPSDEVSYAQGTLREGRAALRLGLEWLRNAATYVPDRRTAQVEAVGGCAPNAW